MCFFVFAFWSLSVQASKSQNLGDDCRRTHRKSVKRKDTKRKGIERQQEICMIMSVTYKLHNIINYACDRRRCNFLLPLLPGMANANRLVARSAWAGIETESNDILCTIVCLLLYIHLYATAYEPVNGSGALVIDTDYLRIHCWSVHDLKDSSTFWEYLLSALRTPRKQTLNTVHQ